MIRVEKLKRVLTIAGAASGGSAGIQADLKTFQEQDVYGMSVITAIVGKHPETGQNIHLQSLDSIEAQFHTAQRQIGIDSVKTGMLFSEEIIEKVAYLLKSLTNQPIIVDPVMIGKLNSKLLKDDAIEKLKESLLPLATVITPNMPEASVLLDNRPITSVDELIEAAIDLHHLGPKYVLVKGGRLEGSAVDVLYDGKTITTFQVPRLKNANTSGAGCSYSAVIAAEMAKGKSVYEAVYEAKKFVTAAIQYGFSYKASIGPTYLTALRTKNPTIQIHVEKNL